MTALQVEVALIRMLLQLWFALLLILQYLLLDSETYTVHILSHPQTSPLCYSVNVRYLICMNILWSHLLFFKNAAFVSRLFIIHIR